MNIKYVSVLSSARLDKAILIYQGSGNTFATLNRVSLDGVIQAGTPLDNADVEELFRNDGKRAAGTYLPANIIEFSADSITWYVKQKTAPIFFKATSTTGRKMNKISGKDVRWPALLFRLTRQSLKCWALSGDKRPEPSTALYRAPFWNVNDTGGVCMPSGIREKLWSKNGLDGISIAITDKMQTAFYESAFTHPNAGSEIANGGHDRLWLSAVKHPQDKFSSAALIKTEHKLKDILK
jgi:PRTRC genetic system protein B